MTIAADIVTNTLYRHLNNKILNNHSPRLHSKAAIDGFIFEAQTGFVGDDYIVDSLYSPNPSALQ